MKTARMCIDTLIFLRQAKQVAPQLADALQNLVTQTNTGGIKNQVGRIHALINVFSRNLKAECFISLLEAMQLAISLLIRLYTISRH